MEGNVDSYSVVRHHLEIPIVGVNRIRLYPYAKHLRTVCLRFELYGCLYEGKGQAFNYNIYYNKNYTNSQKIE